MRNLLLSLSFILTAGMFLFLPSSAFAATFPEPACTGKQCTGLDPYATDCASPSYTMKSQDDELGLGLRIELEYSPHCQTFWAKASSWREHSLWNPDVDLFFKGPDGTIHDFFTPRKGTWSITTNQVYYPRSPITACALTAQFGVCIDYP